MHVVGTDDDRRKEGGRKEGGERNVVLVMVACNEELSLVRCEECMNKSMNKE
jgi:hypothetical protein